MQAIETKFVGPTNHRSARVHCQARTMFVSWDHALGVEGNHDAAAMVLAEKLGWRGKWFAGGNADGSGNVYVNVTNDNNPSFVVTESKRAERIQIPAYTDRWVMGDRFGDLIKVTRKNGEEIAHVRLDKSSKVVRVVLADCEIVS